MKTQGEITREFARRLFREHGSKITVPLEYENRAELPLVVLSWQARGGERPWSDVVLLLNNLPPQMAKDVLLKEDGRGKRTSLHGAALNAPRSVIDRMLALAPDAARVKNSWGNLPLHIAARWENNFDAIEPLMNAYPDALLETNDNGNNPMDEAIKNGCSSDFLKTMLPMAMEIACSNIFHDYGTLLEDKSQYRQSVNPINLIFLEAHHRKRSADDVEKFIKQLERKPTFFRSLLQHTKKTIWSLLQLTLLVKLILNKRILVRTS